MATKSSVGKNTLHESVATTAKVVHAGTASAAESATEPRRAIRQPTMKCAHR